ncbi:MAG: F0F1 ATP synthase subunit B, partial [Calditrichaeota bacterium]|nr:F0F1 ATP synthase subunit B [Calditrichota bacterium]
MMDLHPGLMLWTIISFVLFFFLLKKFAWGPIIQALDAREKGIKDNIQAAEVARIEAEKSLEEYKKQLTESQAEAQKMIADARRDAERVREDLLAKSKAEAEDQINRARKQIELEGQEAVNRIKSDIADLVIDSA